MRRVKVVQIPSILLISFLILVLPIYHHYCALVGADLFPTDVSIESPDEEALLVDREDNGRMSASGALFAVFPSVRSVSNHSPSDSFQTSSFGQARFILRC